MKRLGPLWLGLVMLAAMAVSAAGQAAPEAIIEDRVDVGLIEVDAIVTDRLGRPVTGLGAEDFELAIDGRSVPLVSFAEMGSAEDGPDGPRALSLAVYFDAANLAADRRRDVVSALSTFVRERLGPRDRVMIVASDRFHQDAMTTFTADAGEITTALERVAAMAVHEGRVKEFRDILRGIDRLASSGSDATEATARSQATLLMARIRASAAEAVADATRATATLQHLIDATAGLEGHRAVLYVGGGLLLNPGGLLGEALNQVALSSASTASTDNPRSDVQAWGFDDLSDRFGNLVGEASARRVTLYAIAAGDLGGAAFGQVSGGAEVGIGSSRGRDDSWAPGISASQRLDFEMPLRLLADETGGRATFSGRDDEATLDRLRRDGRAFYALAAEIPRGIDAGRLEVRAKRGLRVAHRKSWRRLDSDDLARDRVRSALFAGASSPTLDFELSAAEPVPDEAGSWTTQVTVGVPIDRVAVVADGDRHRGQLSIFIASGFGLDTAAVQKATLPVRLDNREILGVMGRELTYRFDTRFGAGARIAVGVCDDMDPRLSIRVLELAPNEPMPEPTP